MNNSTLLRGTIIVLLCTNLFFIVEHFRRPKHPPTLSNILEVSGKRALMFDQEMKSHRHTVVHYLNAQAKLRKQLIGTKKDNQKTRMQLLKKIAACQYQIDRATLIHFDRVDALCNPKEKKRFTAFKLKILENKLRH